MGDSTYACNVPGSTRFSSPASTLGWMTATVGIAAVSVSFARAWYCTRRWNNSKPPTTINTATTTKNTVNRGLLLRPVPLLPLFSKPSVVIPSLQTQFHNLSRYRGFRPSRSVPAPLQPSVDNRKHARYEEQCRHGRKQQSADPRAPQRGILFAAFSKPDRHRHHADHHRQRRHDHGTYADEAGFQRCFAGGFPLNHLLSCARN